MPQFTWAVGESLTAAKFNAYLRDRTISPMTAAERAALSSPVEGQVVYETDTDKMFVYNGTSWVMFAAGTAVNNTGLVLLARQTPSGASTVAFEGVFSSTYRNYRVVGSLYGSVATQNVALNFYTGTNTIDNALTYNVWGYRWAGAAIASGNSSAQSSFVFTTTSTTSTEQTSFSLDIFTPNEAVRTKVQSRSLSSGAVLYDYALDKANTSQFTGFQLAAASGTLTGGVEVYGCTK